MEVRYIGDPSDNFAGPGEIDQYGITFVKGEYVSLPDTHPQAAKFQHNPTFQVKGDDRPVVDTDPEADVDELKTALDAKGITYRANANAKSLRKLLADSVDNDVDGPELPPVPA